jgi:diguanylate cyclase (GGDEF)-like protein
LYPLVKNLISLLNSLNSGIRFVYEGLDLVAQEYNLIDAILVTETSDFGRQIFRLGRKPVEENAFEAGLLKVPVGLYCEPEISDLDQGVLLNLFEMALSFEQSKHDARHDSLTNLLNRRSFDEILSNLSVQSGRYGWQFALVLLDLNDFKIINDTKGHLEGDRILKEVARILSGSLRSGDRVARVGGDEFALVLANASMEGANQVVQRIKNSIVDINVTVSAGLALAPLEATEISVLWRLADSRLYKDKQAHEVDLKR